MKKHLQITAGKGPAECQIAASKVLKILLEEAKSQRFKTKVLVLNDGGSSIGILSAIVELEGEDLIGFATSWVGTIKWVSQSTLRKKNKRKNWFIGVDEIQFKKESEQINTSEIKFTSCKASGPGGQNVNKLNTAIRAVHLPTNISVLAMDSRSQAENKKNATSRLITKVKKESEAHLLQQVMSNRNCHIELKRGNPIRVFKSAELSSRKKKKNFKSKRLQLKNDLQRQL